MAALALFAWLLTLIDSDVAGRAFAAYGGVYITCVAAMDVGRRRRPARPLGHGRRRAVPHRRGDDHWPRIGQS